MLYGTYTALPCSLPVPLAHSTPLTPPTIEFLQLSATSSTHTNTPAASVLNLSPSASPPLVASKTICTQFCVSNSSATWSRASCCVRLGEAVLTVSNDSSAKSNASRVVELDVLTLGARTFSGDSEAEAEADDEERMAWERSESSSVHNSDVMLGRAAAEGPAAVRMNESVLR